MDAPRDAKRLHLAPTVIWAACAALWCAAAHAEDPWADAVIAYHAIDPNVGFDTPDKTLGEPVGGGTFAPSNSSVHSIGRPGPDPGSYIVLRFDTPVADDPANPMGLDAIVFGNCTWTGGDPNRKWQEPGLIEISEDVNGNGQPDDPWYVIPGSRGYDRSVLPEGISNPSPALAGSVLNPNGDGTEYDWGYCELTPTQRKCRDNYVRPDDPNEVGLTPRSGGGDAFDIAWAVPVDGSGDPSGVSQFHFIRISSFIDVIAGPFGYITPEIDAVADVPPDIDLDGDGILDEYETRVAGTDPGRPENTVLALEIPPEDGGSPAGAELGTAQDAQGNAVTLYSSGLRSGVRDYNAVVDILSVADPAPGQTIPGLLKSAAVREFQSSVPDFLAAQVQDAELVIAYGGAEIAGLDEPSLAPFRYDGAGFTQDGISTIVRDTSENTVTFRSQYAGVFILASVPGDGDIDTGADAIVLHADPAQGVVGEPGTLVNVTSATILMPGDVPVPDGTHFTVATTLGAIVAADQDGGTPGVQVASSGAVIAFGVQAGTTAGTASITALSGDGLLFGELECLFAAGQAVPSVDLFVLDPEPTAPGPLDFTTSVMADAWGNPLDAGAHVTLNVLGGVVLEVDADPGAAGHQAGLTAGVANFTIRVDVLKNGETAVLDVALYGDPGETVLLAQETYLLEVVPMPMHPAAGLLLVLLLASVGALCVRRTAARMRA